MSTCSLAAFCIYRYNGYCSDSSGQQMSGRGTHGADVSRYSKIHIGGRAHGQAEQKEQKKSKMGNFQKGHIHGAAGA